MANEESWKDQIVRAYVTELQSQKEQKALRYNKARKGLEDEVALVMSYVLGDCLDEAQKGNNYSKTYLVQPHEIAYNAVPSVVQVSDPAIQDYSEKLYELTGSMDLSHHLFSDEGKISSYIQSKVHHYSFSIVGVAKLVFEELTRKQLSPKVVYDDSTLKYYICSTWEESKTKDHVMTKEGQEAERRFMEGDRVGYSHDIADFLTAGFGEIDSNGYWQYPLRVSDNGVIVSWETGEPLERDIITNSTKVL